MNGTPHIATRLQDLVLRYNRELALDAALKALLGVLFSFLVFGLLFWFGWFIGVFVARNFNLQAWQFGCLVSGLFLLAATWSAWRRVNPLAGLPRLTDRQLLLTLLSQASPDILYFSPRHATAGVAVLLIGGPANLFQALGVWAYRIRADAALIEAASRLLVECQEKCPVMRVAEPAAALLLRRLALIKIVLSGESSALTATDKGRAVLSGAKSSARK
jgi:hypothetical protein